MTDYNINLIRDDVLPAQRRRTVFLATAVCIFIAGALVACIANHIARKVAAATDDRVRITLLEQRFADEHPGKPGILEYGDQLRGDLVGASAALASVAHVMRSQTHLSGLLLWLSEPLPDRYYVLNFALERATSTVTFDIAGPAARASGLLQSTDLINAWSSNMDLMTWVSGIQLVLTRRHDVGRREVFVWNFKATLKGGGA